MSTCREKMLNLMVEQEIFVYFYIDYEANQWYLEYNPFLPEFTMSEQYDPINAIIHDDNLAEEDKERLFFFSEKLKNGTAVSKNAPFTKIQFRIKNEKNEAVWYEVRVYPKKTDYSAIPIVTGTFHKMTEQEIKSRNILNFYTNDKNPAIFPEQVSKLIKSDPDNNYAVIQFDIIGFKFVNEKYTETVGTELLHHINDVLELYCNEFQPHSRLNADVFVTVVPYNDIEDIYSFIFGLEATMSGFRGIKYGFAFGVYLVTDRNISFRLMNDYAGLARKSIKGNALENIGFYNHSIKNNMRDRHFIEGKMKAALKNGEFIMYLQPKYNISDSSIIGAEALVRWKDPERGLIPPNEFIPVFEKNGFVIRIDEYIWECACKKIREWIDKGIRPVPVSVNVSRLHLSNSKFIDKLNALIKKYNIPREFLELEITESVDNTDANAKNMIHLAKENGFRLLMDDFGSGYSSLNTLENTQFDVLKIDRCFLSSSFETLKGQKIISHTIAMCKDIGLDLVAEGVETAEEAKFLNSCGCNSAQGFYYSKPIPDEDFDGLFEK